VGAIHSVGFVFAHEVLDGLAFDLCKLFSVVKPEEFFDKISKKTASLAEFKEKGFDSVCSEKLEDFLNTVEGWSLHRKIQLLFELVRPGSNTHWPRFSSIDARASDIHLLAFAECD